MQTSNIDLDRIRLSWSDETAGWGPRKNPARGQCLVTSLLIQDIVNGSIAIGEVNDVRHFWNVLPDGTWLDLTLEQFNSIESFKFICNITREEALTFNDSTYERYLILKNNYYKGDKNVTD